VGFGTFTYSDGLTGTGEYRGGWGCGHWVLVYSDGSVEDYVFDDDGNCISQVFRVSDKHKTSNHNYHTITITTTITTTLINLLHTNTTEYF
jgi:hypothetical protein